jgi:hypothetical protein
VVPRRQWLRFWFFFPRQVRTVDVQVALHQAGDRGGKRAFTLVFDLATPET